MDPATEKRPRRQEQEPASSEITEVAPNILRSQLPIFLPGLGHVNCYFLQDERGLAIVDPGLPGPQSWRALVKRLDAAGYKAKDVHTVVVTHSHPDHFGGAGRFRDKYGAEVITHRSFRTFFDLAEDDTGPDLVEADGAAVDPHAGHGHDHDHDADHGHGHDPEVDGVVEPGSEPLPTSGQRAPWSPVPWRTDGQRLRPPFKSRMRMQVMRKLAKGFIRTPAPTRRVEDAQVIRLAGREWIAVHTPGHTNDHLCLFDPAEGVMLSGDHVLPTITPHISGMVGGDDPLAEFFRSLEKVAEFDGVTLALPAHGHPFEDLAGRTKEIRLHHEERLDVCREAAADLGTGTVEDFTKRLFKQRSWGPMADSETYAHLEHLRVTGEAEARFEDGNLRYRLVD
jgi:glyoxylase-like metal-dependent hydrolase (beta-lactamase superfamily II)